MGNHVQVLPSHNSGAAPVDRGRPRRHARRVFLLVWFVMVAVPWALQIRSFSALVARHKITRNLIPSSDARAVKTPSEIAAHCPLRGLYAAEIWYTIDSAHYYESDSDATGPTLCHFTLPQYNAHGMYLIYSHKVEPMHGAPKSCANETYGASYYYYHGGIGYYSFYAEGAGSFCRHDGTLYTVARAVGSNDINLSALARFDGSHGYLSSYYYGCVGTVWLAFRAIVLARSYLLCSRYGARLDALHESISVPDAVVYIQQAARLAPHSATNWHRFALVYLLVEGLMTDLFLAVVYEGSSAKIQYISLGYNIASLLAMLFEILENSKLLKPFTRLVVKRVLFNTEFGLWGELFYSFAISYYVTAVNRSALGPTPQVAEAVSHYLWGLFNHIVIVIGHMGFILTFRIIGTLVYVRWHYGSLEMLTMPCCVDSVMGYRCKLIKLSGYELNDSGLRYAKQTLKAHGLFKAVDIKGGEFLVCHKIHWLPSEREDLVVFGKLNGEQVDPWPERSFFGPVSVCDRVLGGITTQDC